MLLLVQQQLHQQQTQTTTTTTTTTATTATTTARATRIATAIATATASSVVPWPLPPRGRFRLRPQASSTSRPAASSATGKFPLNLRFKNSEAYCFGFTHACADSCLLELSAQTLDSVSAPQCGCLEHGADGRRGGEGSRPRPPMEVFRADGAAHRPCPPMEAGAEAFQVS